MTLVGYFNSMRELGGMRRLVLTTVYSRARKKWIVVDWRNVS